MTRRLVAVVALCAVGVATAWAQPAPAGWLGFSVTFTSSPVQLTSQVNLGLTFGRAEVVSRTDLSLTPLTGLVAQYLAVGVAFDGIRLRTGMRFDPCFSQYWFEVRGGCCPLELGGLFLVENLAPACQTPNYTIGIVLDLGVAWRPGFFARSLTGFGVKDLYHLIDDDPVTWLTAVTGVWFEEELLHLGYVGAYFRPTPWSCSTRLGWRGSSSGRPTPTPTPRPSSGPGCGSSGRSPWSGRSCSSG